MMLTFHVTNENRATENVGTRIEVELNYFDGLIESALEHCVWFICMNVCSLIIDCCFG